MGVVMGCRLGRRMAVAARLYAVAVAVNVGVAASVADGTVRTRPPIVRWIDHRRAGFDEREMVDRGVVVTLPLADAPGASRYDRSGLN